MRNLGAQSSELLQIKSPREDLRRGAVADGRAGVLEQPGNWDPVGGWKGKSQEAASSVGQGSMARKLKQLNGFGLVAFKLF